jgi:hypothetical protein
MGEMCDEKCIQILKVKPFWSCSHTLYVNIKTYLDEIECEIDSVISG